MSHRFGVGAGSGSGDSAAYQLIFGYNSFFQSRTFLWDPARVLCYLVRVILLCFMQQTLRLSRTTCYRAGVRLDE